MTTTNTRLSDNQVLLLAALDRPTSGFWYRRGNGNMQSGRRATLGSLSRRGLVSYGQGWSLTDAGREVLAALPFGRREQAYRDIQSYR